VKSGDVYKSRENRSFCVPTRSKFEEV